jgi:hypothetical protein
VEKEDEKKEEENGKEEGEGTRQIHKPYFSSV